MLLYNSLIIVAFSMRSSQWPLIYALLAYNKHNVHLYYANRRLRNVASMLFIRVILMAASRIEGGASRIGMK